MANLNLLISKGDTPLSEGAYEQIKPLLESGEIAEVSHWQEADLRLVLGGDGSMLHEAQKDIKRSPENRSPILGLKAGNPKSKGMLLNEVDFNDLDSIAQLMRESVPHRMHYLKVVAKSVRGQVKQVYAFNDVNLFRSSVQCGAYGLSINGDQYIDRDMADGVLVATAQGSAAYNLIAGGTVDSNPEALVLTGINARTLRSLTLGDQSQIDLEVLETQKRPQRLEADGRLIMPRVGQVSVARAQRHFSDLVFAADKPFASKLIEEALRQ